MSGSRTKYYLDKRNAKWKGVCAGIADYTGVDVFWVRLAFVLVSLLGGTFIPLVAYLVIAWMGTAKPLGLYGSTEDAKFWQSVRSNPRQGATEVRSKLRDIDRRLADLETFYTSRNTRLASEIDSLR